MNNEDKALHDGEYDTNSTEHSSVDVAVSILTFNIFFDGTWNSRENSDWYNNPIIDGQPMHGQRSLKDREDKKYNPKSKILVFNAGDSVSFARAPSVVDQMHRASEQKTLNKSLYIDGSGVNTRKANPKEEGGWQYHGDDPIGAGVGMGGTGVRAKLYSMLKLIQTELNQYLAQSIDPPAQIFFNVYGFSRGAATARMFCHKVFTNKNDHWTTRALDLRAYDVRFNFVGLFDTVSSIGTNHEDDLEEQEQNLTFAKKDGTKVVHIVAGNEYRQKYGLMNIAQSVRADVGLEFAIPGCHTDIGDGLSTLGEVDEEFGKWNITGRDGKSVILEKKHQDIGSGQEIDQTKDITNLNWFKKFFSPKSLEGQMIANTGQRNADLIKVMAEMLAEGWAVNGSQSNPYLCDNNKCTTSSCAVKQLQQAKAADLNNLISKDKGKTTEAKKPDSKNTQLEIYIKCTSSKHQLILDKKQINIDYPKIPAYIMLAFMTKYKVNFLSMDKMKMYSIENPTSADVRAQDAQSTLETNAQIRQTLRAAFNDLKSQAMALDADKIKDIAITDISNSSRDEPQILMIKDEALAKQINNRHIHFSSDSEGFGLQVNVANFNNQTQQFYRNVFSG